MTKIYKIAFIEENFSGGREIAKLFGNMWSVGNNAYENWSLIDKEKPINDLISCYYNLDTENKLELYKNKEKIKNIILSTEDKIKEYISTRYENIFNFVNEKESPKHLIVITGISPRNKQVIDYLKTEAGFKLIRLHSSIDHKLSLFKSSYIGKGDINMSDEELQQEYLFEEKEQINTENFDLNILIENKDNYYKAACKIINLD